MPTEACRIVALVLELVRATRDYVASHTEPSNRCVNNVVVKASISVRNLGNNEQIEVAIRSVAAFGAAAE